MNSTNLTEESSWFRSFTSGSFFKSRAFWMVTTGTLVTTLVAYGVYTRYFSQKSNATPKQGSKGNVERANMHIRQELKRLQNPKLKRERDSGQYFLEKKDFFDLLLIIQLKTKLQLQKNIGRNQRERVRYLDSALADSVAGREQLEAYVKKTMDIMQEEFSKYEEVLTKILDTIGISNDVWEDSKDWHISNPETSVTADEDQDNTQKLSIENIDKRSYEYLPQPHLPKSLSKDKAKGVMIDSNHRASQIFRNQMRDFIQEQYPHEYEPLIMETLSYDIAFLEFGINENVFRYAIHKYELSKDPEVLELLEEYLSS